jgi:protein phosphatase
MELFFSGLSDVGNARGNNEDYLFAGQINEGEYLFIVADGMGGHRAGEVASRKAVTTFVRLLEKGTEDDIPGCLTRILLSVNESLVREGSRSAAKNGMGTTLSALYVKDELGYVVHVGDSRVYRLSNPGKDKALEQLTEDHSFVGRLLKDGFITEEEARHHPRRNVLYQSVGVKPEISVQALKPISIRKGHKYLLCTDGLYGVVPDSKIEEFLTGHSTAAAARRLIEEAKANGGPDNITVIVVSTEEDDDTGKLDITRVETVEEDTVKLAVPGENKKSGRRRKIIIFILLSLLVLLLAAAVYFLVTAAGDDRQPPVGPGTRESDIMLKTKALLE